MNRLFGIDDMTTTKRTTSPRRHKAAPAAPEAASASVGSQYLETLLGYNTHRAALTLVEGFKQSMEPFALRTVDFSVLSVIHHQPGVTSRQLCQQLFVLPPNMVVMLRQLEERDLIERHPHPTDRRAIGLSLSASGQQLIKAAEQAALAADQQASNRLSATERKTLAHLLQKIYLPTP